MTKYVADTMDKRKINYFFYKLNLIVPETQEYNEEGEEVHVAVNSDPMWLQDLFHQWKLKFVAGCLNKS